MIGVKSAGHFDSKAPICRWGDAALRGVQARGRGESHPASGQQLAKARRGTPKQRDLGCLRMVSGSMPF